jgi:NDP-sugar pyrophosphorylase family protein
LRALILTAGLGTRLRPLTFVRAKAAVPVNGQPIVRRVIGWLVGQGIDDLVLNLHHRPQTIAAVVGDGRDLHARVRYSWEDPVLGSAGGPRHALPLLTDGLEAGDRHFLLVNGDTLTDLALAPLIEAHRRSGALVTMALTPNPRPDAYGGVAVADGRVTGFTPRGVRDSYHFIGVQVADARAFSSLEDGVPAESVMQLYPQLMSRAPGSVAAYIAHPQFRDVGTPADYLQTSLEYVAEEGNHLVSSRRTVIDPTAVLRSTAVWDDVRVGAGVELTECIVCDGVRLPDGARYSRCALVPYGGELLRPEERLDGSIVVRPF